MPKINYLYLLLCSNLVLLKPPENVIYDGKTVEEMKSSLWNSNSDGFYYLDLHPIDVNETIIALTSIEKDEQSKGYTDIITYKLDEKKYNFYLYQYNKEKLDFEKNPKEPDYLFQIDSENTKIDSVRNLYVGKFTGDKKGYLVSFNNKDDKEALIHYLVYDNTKISLTEKYNIKSNIIILNRNANNQSQILYQDEQQKFQTCVLNNEFECKSINNLKGDENAGNCKMSLQGGVAYIDVDGNCSPDIIIGCDQDKNGIKKRIIRIYTSTRGTDDVYHFAKDLEIGDSDQFGPFIISRLKNERNPSIAPQLDILVPLIKTTDKTQVLGLKNIIQSGYDWKKIYCNETDEFKDTTAERKIFEIDRIYDLEDPDKKTRGFDNGIALIRPGDFLSNGLPGILVREKIDDNGNKIAISLYEKKVNGNFSLYLRVNGNGDKVGEPKDGIFFDINESGSLGLIIRDKEGKNHFIYNYKKNAFFVKAKLMNDRNNYYDSNVGASFRYIVTDSDGDRFMDISYQLAQTSDGNIPLPFSLIGLNDTSNYVEYFEMISGNHYQNKELFEDDEFRNFKYQSPIVPNTQMAIFKYINEDSKYDWHLDLFVLPTENLLIIALVIVAVMLIILGVIIYLHVREVKEEQKETNKFKSWFA